MRLLNKLLGQGYVKERLKSSLRKFYGRYGDLIKQYEVPLSRMLHDILDDDHIQRHPCYVAVCNNYAICNTLQTALNVSAVCYTLQTAFRVLKNADKTQYEINV